MRALPCHRPANRIISQGLVSQVQLASRPVRLFDRFFGLAGYRARDAGTVMHRERLPEFTACRSVEGLQDDCRSTG